MFNISQFKIIWETNYSNLPPQFCLLLSFYLYISSLLFKNKFKYIVIIFFLFPKFFHIYASSPKYKYFFEKQKKTPQV